MQALRPVLRRLARGHARALGGVRAGRWHIAALLAACAVAFFHRAVAPLPLLRHLDGRWLLVLGVAAVLFLLGPLLRAVFAFFVTPSDRALARTLDDRHAWRDETDTAAGLSAAASQSPLGTLVVAQAGGRLRELEADVPAAGRVPWTRLRVALVALFVALFLLPGVDGLLGIRGGGRLGGDATGSEGAFDPGGVPAPYTTDVWLDRFVERPFAAEPLPSRGPPAEVPVRAPKGAK